MILIVKNRDKIKLGTITFSENNEPVFLGSYDPEFKEFVQKSLKTGITRLIDKYEKDTFYTLIGLIIQKDNNFPLALKEFLERAGYLVEQRHPEVEKQIRQLLADFPDANPDKKDILDHLEEMSYLEQTAILEGLKQIVNSQ